MKTFSFEKLFAWQKARELNKIIYITTKDFPREELYGMTSQMRRSAVSICSNLAEGSARISNKESARFYEVAYGSSIELLNLMILSNDFGYTDDIEYDRTRNIIYEVSGLIHQLHKSQKLTD